MQIVLELLEKLRQKNPQYDINGHRNTWILKPGGKSRGRGIKCFRSYEKMMQHIRKIYARQWVVQKYIENPMLILRKKFDIRQWVLVTDWNPLTIWIYRECYVRFSPIDYDIKKISNKYMHLTNNAVVSKSEKFQDSEIEGNMWSCDELSDHLMETYGGPEGKDIFQEVIWP
jgi:tubulin monoglycylase TTLL3/8